MRLTFIIFIFLRLFLPLFAQEDILIDSLESELKNEHNVSNKIDLYIQLVEAYAKTDVNRALDLSNDVIRLAESLNDTEKIGQVHILQGNLYLQLDRVEQAEEQFKLAIKYLENTDAHTDLIRAHTALGNRYIEKENYPAAMDHYLIGMRISGGLANYAHLANLYNNLGVVYINLNNPQKALELYAKALKLFEEKNDTVNIAGTTTNIGSIYIQLGNFEIARQYYNDGLNLFKQIGLVGGQAHALFKLGILDEMEADYERAIINLDNSLELQQSIEVNPSGSKTMFQAETYVHMGICYFEQDNIASAHQYLIDAYAISKQTRQYSLISMAAKYLGLIARQQYDFEKALNYHEIYKQYSDSLYDEENVRKLTQLEMQYQYESKLTEARLEKEVEKQRSKRNNLIYIVLIVGLFLFLVIIALLLKLEKNKKKKVELERSVLEEKLDHTNKELTTYVMYLLRKNEFILSIIEKLKKARIDATQENKKVIAELISQLQSNADMVSWEEFEIRFQEVHTDFYTNLNKNYPDLTNNEIRLCAFFRLNMTSKEIAAITYQSLNSIKVARYRLRKKLNLGQDDSLISFLSKL